jgi:hypothetical protein
MDFSPKERGEKQLGIYDRDWYKESQRGESPTPGRKPDQIHKRTDVGLVVGFIIGFLVFGFI